MTSDPEPRRSFAQRATLPITLLVQAASAAALISPAVAAPRLLEVFHIAPVAVGIYIAIVYAAAMISGLWGAALSRRVGPIRTSQAALLLSATGLLLMAAPSLPVAALGALLIGIGYGPITPSSSEMLARTTPPERIALVFSIKQTGVPLGGTIAGLLVPSVLLAGGIAGAMVVMAGLCLLGALLAQLLRRDLDDQRNPSSRLPVLSDIGRPIKAVLRHPILKRVALASLIFSIVQAALTAYIVSFLTANLGWTLVQAGAASAVAQGAAVFGRVLWGAVADRMEGGARRMLLALAAAMALSGVAMLALTPTTPTALVLLLLGFYGATAIGWNGVYLATVARVAPAGEAATATAGCLFFTFMGVVIGSPLFGAVGSAFGSLGPAFAALALPLLWAMYLLGSRWPQVR